MKLYEAIQQKLKENKTAVLVTEWDRDEPDGTVSPQQYLKLPSEGKEGAETCREVLETGRPVFKEEQGRFRVEEPFFPEDRLIILGGGHVALPLAEFAAKTGFSVTVADDRLSFANPGRFPWADRVICNSFEQGIRELRIRRQDYVCILTRGHRYDAECLRTILGGEEPGYLGMIGSRRRVALLKEGLLEEGVSPQGLGRLHSPIGLDIGGITPEEIAVSILAELIAAKRKGNTEKNLRNQSDLDYQVLERLASEEQVPKAVVTIIRTKGSVPRRAGAKMLVYPDGRLLGSIGGGCSEAAVLTAARQLIGTGKSLLQHVDLTGEAAEDEGMVCGGVMDVLIQDVPAE